MRPQHMAPPPEASQRKLLGWLRLLAELAIAIAVGAILFWLTYQEWHQDDPDLILINLVVLGFVGLLLSTSLYFGNRKNVPGWLKWFGALNQELAGALILSALILFLVTIPEHRKEEADFKAQLIREMGSPDNGIARRAVRELQAEGWLTDGSLQGADLNSANLEEARLGNANLQDADLTTANLQGANLLYAWLEEAMLEGANLQGTNLGGAQLDEAVFTFADLGAANLTDADLRGADLRGADLQGASLSLVDFDDNTTLPDGTAWLPGTDMTRFTDATHPNFWRSTDPRSPAYLGGSVGYR